MEWPLIFHTTYLANYRPQMFLNAEELCPQSPHSALMLELEADCFHWCFLRYLTKIIMIFFIFLDLLVR